MQLLFVILFQDIPFFYYLILKKRKCIFFTWYLGISSY